MNPWKTIKLQDYESHMKLDTVKQLQALNSIMRDQIDRYHIKTLCVLGVAGGNGLEHIPSDRMTKVYGVDINDTYLKACRQRWHLASDILELIHTDLRDVNHTRLPNVELVIANLLIEYVGIDIFIKHILKMNARYVSVVIQVDNEDEFVSDSPYLTVLTCLDKVHQTIHPKEFITNMEHAGYLMTYEERMTMPNKKELVRLDFKVRSIHNVESFENEETMSK